MPNDSSAGDRPGPDFRAIFESVPGALLVLSPDLTMVAANRDRFSATMTTPEGTIGRPLFDLFPDNPEDPATEGVRNLMASLDRVRATLQPDSMPVQKYDIPRPESEGGGFEERYWSPVNTPVVIDGKLAYIIHGVVDVTDYVRMEQQGTERARLAQQLQGEKQQMAAEILSRQRQVADSSRQLKELNAELARMYEKSQELDRAKSAFFANVSHELRTPLALILGRAEKLLERHDELPPDSVGHLRSILANAQVLLQQVNELLEAATMESGDVELQWRDLELGSVVRRTVANFESAAIDAGIEMRLDVPDREIVAQGDQRRISAALANLIANAIKFTPPGGAVRCRADADDEQIVVEVADTGPGIPEEMHETVFERFRQVDAGPDRVFGGTGLGLSIVKDVAQLHSGDVEASRAPEGGALFRLTLPRRAPEDVTVLARDDTGIAAAQAAIALAAEQQIAGTVTSGEGSPADARDERQVVLIVEDNPDLGSFIANELRSDYRVLRAADGREALEVVARHRVDLILTDVMMPGMDGETLLHELKADPRYEEIPAIVLTARTDADLRLRLLKSGASDYLSKPFSVPELRARVGNVADAANLRLMLRSRVQQRTGERDEAQRRLAHVITHDALTGLPNRLFVVERIAEMLRQAPGDQVVGVLVINLDDLKRINDAMGHAAGDQVLKRVGQRLRRLTSVNGVLGRVGSDEFVIAGSITSGPDGEMDYAARVLREVSRPIRVPGDLIVVTASIGVTSAAGGSSGATAESLLGEGDLAMQRAKSGGKNRFALFDPSLQSEADARLATEQALRRGLQADELSLHYQPELDMRTGHIHGLEALIRWQRPGHGLSLPGEFLPVAQVAGLMPEIDRLVLRTACTDSLRWQDALRSTGGRVWVNLSADLLRRADLPEVVAEARAEAGAPPELIGVEITETLAMDADLDSDPFRRLVGSGVAMAIDDFGTGYSALASLRYFPASILKLDQSLIADVSRDPDASSIVGAAIDMGHTLGLNVLAEGVETAEQRARLQMLHCDMGQGWHLGRPVPAGNAWH